MGSFWPCYAGPNAEPGIGLSESEDHGVAGSGGQQIVNLFPHLVVSAYAASGLEMEPIDARGQLNSIRRQRRRPSLRGLNIRCTEREGLSAQASADRVVELVEAEPAPIRAAVGEDAEKLLGLVREKSDTELDELRRQYVGLD